MPSNETADTDYLWGAPAIARAIGLSTRQVYWHLEAGNLPCKKIGSTWVGSKARLREALGGDLPKPAA